MKGIHFSVYKGLIGCLRKQKRQLQQPQKRKKKAKNFPLVITFSYTVNRKACGRTRCKIFSWHFILSSSYVEREIVYQFNVALQMYEHELQEKRQASKTFKIVFSFTLLIRSRVWNVCPLIRHSPSHLTWRFSRIDKLNFLSSLLKKNNNIVMYELFVCMRYFRALNLNWGVSLPVVLQAIFYRLLR